MARYKGKSTLNQVYNINDYRPLDTRMLVPTYSDLTLESNWLVDGESNSYNGMIVAVGSNTADVSKNGIYYLFDAKNPGTDDVPDVTKEENWHKIGSGGAGIDGLTISIEHRSGTEYIVIKDKDGNELASTNASIFATSAALNEVRAIAAAAQSAQQVSDTIDAKIAAANLDQYAKAADLDGKVDLVAYNTDKASFATKSDISGIGSVLSELDAVVKSKVDTDAVYTKDTVYTKEETLEEIANKIAEVDLDQYAKQSDLAQYAKLTDITAKLDASTYIADKAQLDSALTGLNGLLASKAEASNVYTKDDVYTKEETLDKIAEKITEVNGGESAGEVLSQLNSYKETNNARVAAIEAENAAQTVSIGTLQSTVEELVDNVVDLDERLDTIEAFFDGAANDGEGLNDALDKLKDIQDFLATEDGTTVSSMLDTIKANTTAISTLQNLVNNSTGSTNAAVAALDSKIAAIEADYMKASDLVNDAYVLNCGSATQVLHVATN